jgi:hypothetical protein
MRKLLTSDPVKRVARQEARAWLWVLLILAFYGVVTWLI